MFFQLILQIIKPKEGLLITAIVAGCHLSFAQSSNVVDSLKNILKTAKEDTNQVNTLNDLSKEFWRNSHIVESKNYAEKAMDLASKLNFKKGIATALGQFGLIYRNQGNYPEALKNYFASLNIYQEIGDKPGIADSYNNLGLVYPRLGNYSEAMKSLLSSLKIYEELGDKKGISDSYNNIGLIYYSQGNYTDALKSFLGSLAKRKEIGDKKGMAASYINIADICRKHKNDSGALNYSNEALKLYREVENPVGIAISYTSIGSIYESQGNYSEALKSYLAALKLREEIGIKNGIAISYIKIGNVYTKLERYSEARKYLNNGVLLSKEIAVTAHLRDAYEGLAKLDSAIGDYRQALVHYKLYTGFKDRILNEANSIQISQMKEQYESEKKDRQILQLTSQKQKLESDQQISALLLKTKEDSLIIVQAENNKIQLENDKVLLESEKIQALNLYNEQQIELMDNEKQVQQLQMEKDRSAYAIQKAEADKKQEQLLILNKERTIQDLQLKKQRQANRYFVAGLVLIAILFFFIYRGHRTRQKLTLLTLRNKIASDLHDDIGSTLSSISIFSQMAQQQSKETIPMLETIGESSSKMLDAMADIVWTIKPENDQFEKIIMRMRSFAYELLGAKNIDFEFVADDDVEKFNLPMEVRRNLYLIFKEATNNMVKYSGARRAMFAIKGEKNTLTMIIKDDGKGFNANGPTIGNGLKNMRQRAKEMGADFMIDSRPGDGTTIRLKVAV